MNRQPGDFVGGMIRGMQERSSGRELKYKALDWDKASKIIGEKNARNVQAGLMEDWDLTSCTIVQDGIRLSETNNSPYFGSIWATPIIVINEEEIECWKYLDEAEIREFKPTTLWPDNG